MPKTKSIKKNKKGYESCSGCGVCLLVCPQWRRTSLMSVTRKARARAMQAGVLPEEIASSIDACLVCGSCEPACPEEISITSMNIEQRIRLNRARSKYPSWYPVPLKKAFISDNSILRRSTIVLAGGSGLGQKTCEHIINLLGGSKKAGLAADDGRDIAALIEAGMVLDDERIKYFLNNLRYADTLVVAEGILHLPLREWLPGKKIKGFGEALMDIRAIRRSLGPEDMYIIESRGYHSDFERLVKYYDRLRHETGCQMNLDLQRIAIPTGASSLQARHNIETAGCLEHAKWIMKGRRVKRIVVEDFADIKVFQLITDIPVIHISGLI